MKKIIVCTLFTLLAVLSFQSICVAQESKLVPLYRLFNGFGHFYTTNVAERDSAIKNASYRDEGIAGYVYGTQVSGTIPLYRLVVERKETGTRHYYATTERQVRAAKKDGYTSEDICCYISATQQGGTLPFYQLYGSVADDHLYTTVETEKYEYIHKHDYVIQPTAGYIWAGPSITIRKRP